MAIYYVNSDATGGTNTGGTWANAFLSFWSLPALLSGDYVYVASTHVDAGGGGGSKTLTLPASGECAYIFSVIAGTTTQQPGAFIQTIAATGNMTFDGSMYIYGCTFSPLSASTFTFISDGNESGVLVSCTFQNAPAGSVILTGVSTVNCTIDLSRDAAGASRAIMNLGCQGTNQQHVNMQISNAENRTGNASALITAATTAGPGIQYFHGCDFSGIPSACELFEGGPAGISVELHQCRLPSTYSVLRTTATTRFRFAMYNCGFDNAAVKNVNNQIYMIASNLQTYYAVYLNGANGAISNDGGGTDVQYCWGNAGNTVFRGAPAVTDWLYAYVQPGTYTVSIEVASLTGSSINASKIYAEIDYLYRAGDQEYNCIFTPGAGAPESQTAYPAGGTWTGGPTITARISFANVVVTQAGLIRGRVYIVTNSDSYYINPKLIVA